MLQDLMRFLKVRYAKISMQTLDIILKHSLCVTSSAAMYAAAVYARTHIEFETSCNCTTSYPILCHVGGGAMTHVL